MIVLDEQLEVNIPIASVVKLKTEPGFRTGNQRAGWPAHLQLETQQPEARGQG